MTISDSSMDVRWLHISDFHLKAVESYDRDRVLNALVKSLTRLINRTGPVDFVIASGDIAYSGKADEYPRATVFFDEVLGALNLTRKELFVTPGNHDNDRSSNNSLSRTPDNSTKLDNFFTLEDPILHCSVRQKNFVAWYNEYFDGIREFNLSSTVLGVHDFDGHGKKIRITLINSATFSADEHDNGNLAIGRRCLEAAFATQIGSTPADLSLSVLHHPLTWLSTNEVSNIKALLRDHSDIIASGHLHETDVEQVQGIDGGALHLVAGASYQASEWPNTALICTLSHQNVNVLPIQFIDRPKPTWTIDPSIFPDEPNFSKDFCVARLAQSAASHPQVRAGSDFMPSDGSRSNSSQIKAEWQDDLLTSPNGRAIYVEPRLMSVPQAAAMNNEDDCKSIDIQAIIEGPESYLIESGPEHGGSNLGRRLAYEIDDRGGRAFFGNARNLPNYKSKLLKEIDDGKDISDKYDVIIDNFDCDRDQRLLKELEQTKIVRRVILISINRDISGISLNDANQLPFPLERVYLWQLSRDGLRHAASLVFDTTDSTFVSKVVDKIYQDLLSLCIPLTPPSAIMYLRVLAKETDFTPLNRVHIINRYISENLSRSSDIYRGNFNSKNKIDIIASFTWSLFESKSSSFTSQQWFSFCAKHKSDTLKEFEEDEFFSELKESGIFIKIGPKCYFKYSFFYNFFLGRYLASNRDQLRQFLDNRLHLEVPGIIDVVTGLEADNAAILTQLTAYLQEKHCEFAGSYVKSEFDPLLHAIWPDANQEEETFWKPVYAAIEQGPQSVAQIDELKTSLLAEARTTDQQVTFKQFNDLENSLFIINGMLSDALRNSDDAPAQLKLNALEAILRSELIAFQVGTMFADKLASNRFFVWGNVLFSGFNVNSEENDPESLESIITVIVNVSHAVANKIGDEIGTYKLANVFRKRAENIRDIGFIDVLIFSCILEAKGPDWDSLLQAIILKTSKNAFYLNVMLNLLMRSLKIGLEKGRDLESSKRLVALIHSKRGHGKERPGEKMVTRVLRSLETEKVFDFKNENDDSSSQTAEVSHEGHR